ncbi:hypothetical protein CLOM_g3227 [Closterium sp. NIES-68]|nr:hypothetical protein CLOM_g3227 [Closterium sp. NIES-68]GJP76374.1 hypothetical protein CLOP_g6829 [Closterium sp. NIES-67]
MEALFAAYTSDEDEELDVRLDGDKEPEDGSLGKTRRKEAEDGDRQEQEKNNIANKAEGYALSKKRRVDLEDAKSGEARGEEERREGEERRGGEYTAAEMSGNGGVPGALETDNSFVEDRRNSSAEMSERQNSLSRIHDRLIKSAKISGKQGTKTTDRQMRTGDQIRRVPSAAAATAAAASAVPAAAAAVSLPPPPDDLFADAQVDTANVKAKPDYGGRVRTFPHVEGNFAVHVLIPVTIAASLQPLLESHLLSAMRALPALSPVDPDSLKAAPKQFAGAVLRTPLRTALGAGAVDSLGGRFIPAAAPLVDDRVFGGSPAAAGSDAFDGAGGGCGSGGSAAVAAAAVHGLVTGEMHLTAARTVPIRFHQIDSLLSLLRLRLKPLKRFCLHLDKWTAFVNDERTRSFLALEATREGVPEFVSMVECIDQAYAVHNLPPYYDNPRPHVSLLWVAGNHLERLLSIAQTLQMSNLKNAPALCIRVNVRKVICRVGQKVHTVWEDNRRALL